MEYIKLKGNRKGVFNIAYFQFMYDYITDIFLYANYCISEMKIVKLAHFHKH